MNENYKFAKFIRINNKYKAYNDEKEIIKLYEKEVNNLQSKIDKANKLLDKLTSKYILNEDYKKLQEILKEAENVENN